VRALGRRQILTAAAALVAAGCGRRRPPPGHISLWFSYGGNNRKVLLALVERFHRAQTAVRVVPTFQGDYFEGLVKLRTGLFVGSVPTVTHVVGEVLPYLAEAGVLAPLEGVGADVLADLDPALSQAGTFVGGARQRLWALPFNRSTPIAFVNQKLFDAERLTPPRTWDELREVARRATVRRGGATERWGFACPVDWWFWVALTGQAGGRLVEDDGTLSLGGEAGVSALALWQAMVREDRSMRPPPGRDYNAWEATNTDFLAGRAAMIWTSTAFLRYLEDNARFPVVAAPLPAGERRAVPTGGTFFVMPRGLDQAEEQAGLAFLRWMMQPAQSNDWATGTGYMPVSLAGRATLARTGFFRRHPSFLVTLTQLGDALPWPWAPRLFRAQREAVQPLLEEAVLTGRAAREALDEALVRARQP
jgi:sn-glycerol 3-phosphate transport system substrate-binding protein